MRVEFALVDSVEVLTLQPDAHTVIGRKATEDDRQCFKAQYRAFKAQGDAPAPAVATDVVPSAVAPPHKATESQASTLGPDEVTPPEPTRRFFDKKKKK